MSLRLFCYGGGEQSTAALGLAAGNRSTRRGNRTAGNVAAGSGLPGADPAQPRHHHPRHRTQRRGSTMTSDPIDMTHTALRAWAKGIYPLEAGVELLIRPGLATPGYAWIQPNSEGSGWWVDAEQINDDTIGAYSGGQIRLLHIAASLLGGPPANLFEDIPGLDRHHLVLVLAGIAHAGGSHQHSGDLVPDPNGRWRDADGVRMGFARLGSLHSWPDEH